jgi:hypothetical protein
VLPLMPVLAQALKMMLPVLLMPMLPRPPLQDSK